MSIYIPIVPILWGLLVFALVGIVLYVPLVAWQDRFVSNYRLEKGRNPFRHFSKTLIVKGLLASAVAWPILFGYTIRTEIVYRRKGYL